MILRLKTLVNVEEEFVGYFSVDSSSPSELSATFDCRHRRDLCYYFATNYSVVVVYIRNIDTIQTDNISVGELILDGGQY